MGCVVSDLVEDAAGGEDHADEQGRSLSVPDRIRRASIDLTDDLKDGSVETLTGHFDRITSLAANGKHLLSGSQDRTIFEWNMGEEPHRCVNVYRGHKGPVMCLIPWGRNFVAGGADCIVSVWGKRDCGGIITLEHTQRVYCLCRGVAEDAMWAGCSDGTLQLMDMQKRYTDGSPVKAHAAAVQALLLSPDKSRLISASKDGYVKEWEAQKVSAQNEKRAVYAHTGGVACMILWQEDPFKQDQYDLVTGGYDSQLKVWSYPDYTVKATMSGHQGTVYAVAVTPGNDVVSCAADSTVRRWSITGEPLGLLTGHTSTVHAVYCNPGTNMLYTAGADNEIKSWKLDGSGHVEETFWSSTAAADLASTPAGTGARRSSIFTELNNTGDQIMALAKKPFEAYTEEDLQLWLAMVGLGDEAAGFKGQNGSSVYRICLTGDAVAVKYKYKLPQELAQKLLDEVNTAAGKMTVGPSPKAADASAVLPDVV